MFRLIHKTLSTFIDVEKYAFFYLTSLFNGQSITGHGDLLLRGPDPVQHAPPALHREGEVGAGGCRALVDAQHWGGRDWEDGGFVSEQHLEVTGFFCTLCWLRVIWCQGHFGFMRHVCLSRVLIYAKSCENVTFRVQCEVYSYLQYLTEVGVKAICVLVMPTVLAKASWRWQK